MNRMQSRRQSVRIAFCAMAAALSAVVMLLGGVIPVATYAVPMLCGLILLPVLMEFGAPSAWAAYAAVALIALLLGLDKEAAFFYIFMGYYPIIKWKLDRLAPAALRTAVKLLFFAASLAAMYGLLALLFPMELFLREFEEMGVGLTVAFAAVFLLCMLLYDRLLPRMAALYVHRVKPKWKGLNR